MFDGRLIDTGSMPVTSQQEGLIYLDSKYFTPIDNGSGGLTLQGVTTAEVQDTYEKYITGLKITGTNKNGFINQSVDSFIVNDSIISFQYRFALADYDASVVNVYQVLISATIGGGIITPVNLLYSFELNSATTLKAMASAAVASDARVQAIVIDGDGSTFKSCDGTYKEIDLSPYYTSSEVDSKMYSERDFVSANFVTRSEFHEEIDIVMSSIPDISGLQVAGDYLINGYNQRGRFIGDAIQVGGNDLLSMYQGNSTIILKDNLIEVFTGASNQFLYRDSPVMTLADMSSYVTNTALVSGLSNKADSSLLANYALKTDVPDISVLATNDELTEGLASKANASELLDCIFKGDNSNNGSQLEINCIDHSLILSGYGDAQIIAEKGAASLRRQDGSSVLAGISGVSIDGGSNGDGTVSIHAKELLYNGQPIATKTEVLSTEMFALKTEIPSLDGYAKLVDIPDISALQEKGNYLKHVGDDKNPDIRGERLYLHGTIELNTGLEYILMKDNAIDVVIHWPQMEGLDGGFRYNGKHVATVDLIPDVTNLVTNEKFEALEERVKSLENSLIS